MSFATNFVRLREKKPFKKAGKKQNIVREYGLLLQEFSKINTRLDILFNLE